MWLNSNKFSFEYYDPDNKVSLNGKTRIITLELSKVGNIVDKPINEMSIQELWAIFFRYLTDKSKRDKINEIVRQEEGIAMVGQVVRTISHDEEERARILRDETNELDWQNYTVTAKREGRKEKAEEIARKMKNAGEPLSKIIEFTSLSSEVVNEL